MSIFCFKKLNPPKPRLGQKLREARETFGVNVSTAAHAIRVPAKYIEALEKNHFNELPKAKVFRQNYLKEYAKFLHLDEEAIATQFMNENGFKGLDVVHPKQSVRNAPLFSISILARNLLIACFILLFAGYLAWQVKRVLEPPRLIVYNPAEGITMTERTVAVQGETEKECKLAINGQEIMPDEKGRFNLQVDLSDGLNTIVITATKKHGKISTVTRHIVVKSIGYGATQIMSINNFFNKR
ncbi:MAG: helix-turn-helix domain-containing protein [Candidatus Magasanikbacteria bacterium]|nr:helix-turn-helix domain-containing protein [Candidatus Magasanikbacteria bacterium]